MTLTKKQKRHALIILIGVIVIGIILFLVIKNLLMLTFVRHGGDLQISNFDERTWSASLTAHTSSSGVGENNILTLVITHPSESGVKYAMLCDKINSIIGAGTCEQQRSDEFTGTFNSRVDGLGRSLLGKQFMIFEGTYNDGNCISHSFKTYGLCDTGFQCYIYDPAPIIEGAGGECLIGELFPTSIKIYFKSGGYTEESGKLEFGLTPSGCYSDSDCSPDENLGNVCFEENIMDKTKVWDCLGGTCIDSFNYDLIETCENGCENAECKDEFNFVPILIIIGVIILIGGLTFVYIKFKR